MALLGMGRQSTDRSRDYAGVAKSGLDICMGAFATFGGTPGWIIGGGYFLPDAVVAFDRTMITTPYKYLYNRLYSWNLKTWGEKDIPLWNALFGVTFMMFLNSGLLGILLQLFGVNIFLRDELNKKELVIIKLSLFVVNYFIFIHKSNYRSITRELKK